MTSSVVVCPSADRFHTDLGWLDSRHSFSFGRHYDAANTHFGQLLVSNDDIVQPGTGFREHAHADTEILSWVLTGSLVHEDSVGNRGVIYPGLAQRISAGTGISHSERNDSWDRTGASRPLGPAHLVQMWVAPDESGITPGYEQSDVSDQLATGGLVPVASGMRRYHGSSAIGLHNSGVAFLVARLPDLGVVTMPTAPFLHLYVAKGTVRLEGCGPLTSGDAVRITYSDGQRVTSDGSSEVLVWEMQAEVNAR